MRFAIADGATESSFARLWAQLLVRGFGRGRFGLEDLGDHLPWMQKLWLRIVKRRPLPWYAEMALDNGAHAAFAGLELGEDGAWHAVALGDACVFQVSGEGELIAAFPVSASTDFGSRPPLLSSQPRHNATVLSKVVQSEGRWETRDQFYLLTDAIAAWFLRSAEEGKTPWTVLDEFNDEEAFRDWVKEQRGFGLMRNDDVTVVRIVCGAVAGD